MLQKAHILSAALLGGWSRRPCKSAWNLRHTCMHTHVETQSEKNMFYWQVCCVDRGVLRLGKAVQIRPTHACTHSNHILMRTHSVARFAAWLEEAYASEKQFKFELSVGGISHRAYFSRDCVATALIRTCSAYVYIDM